MRALRSVTCGVSRLEGLPTKTRASLSDLAGATMDRLVLLDRAGILSSGGAPSAIEGLPMLRSMVDAADGQLIIAAGGGVSEENAQGIAVGAGVDELHGSLRRTVRSPMEFRPRIPIPMGAEKVNGPESEFETKEADRERVAAVVRALERVSAPARLGRPRGKSGSSRSRIFNSSGVASLLGESRGLTLIGCFLLGFALGVRVARTVAASSARRQ